MYFKWEDTITKNANIKFLLVHHIEDKIVI